MQKIIRGIIVAIIVAILFFFGSNLFMAGIGNIYSILFIAVGAVLGFFLGYTNKKRNFDDDKESFFSFSWSKAGWAVLLFFVTSFILLFIGFMEIMPTKAFYNIGLAYGWIFMLGVFLTNYIAYSLFPQLNGSLIAFGSTLSLVAMLVNLLWDYFLVCLILYIIRKFKK